MNLSLHVNIICAPTYAASLLQELYYARLQESCLNPHQANLTLAGGSTQMYEMLLAQTCSSLFIKAQFLTREVQMVSKQALQRQKTKEKSAGRGRTQMPKLAPGEAPGSQEGNQSCRGEKG